MWNCNSSASPACPARRVLPIVTQSAAADERAATFSVVLAAGGDGVGRHPASARRRHRREQAVQPTRSAARGSRCQGAIVELGIGLASTTGLASTMNRGAVSW